MKSDISAMPIFVAVAETQNFTAAATRFGVSRSAVSQAIRKLEHQLGTDLFIRTTRSVKLTEVGERLYASVHPQVANMQSALEEVASHNSPHGLLRIAVTSIAEQFLSGELISAFAQRFPEVELDVTVTDDEQDIIRAGFDAGVRLGENIEQDMIAIPVSDPQRDCVVATPAYLERHGRPKHPSDLLEHRCIGWRPEQKGMPYKWEFSDQGRDFEVSVKPQITTNDFQLMLRTALQDGGITFATAGSFAPYLKTGQLVSLLEDYLPPFPGFYLFYPKSRNVPAKLRAMVDFVKEWRG